MTAVRLRVDCGSLRGTAGDCGGLRLTAGWTAGCTAADLRLELRLDCGWTAADCG